MLCIGLYEPDMERCRKMRERIVGYSMRFDLDFSVYYILDGAVKPEKYAPQLHLALISMDGARALTLAREIYRANPDCRIGYYKSESCDLEPALAARPISFYRWETGNSSFDKKLGEMLEDILCTGEVFRYETRKTSMTLPVQDILYFQSNLKYVDIFMTDPRQQRSIFGKLTDVEQLLEAQGLLHRFLRIHKSYIVNRQQVLMLNKSEHRLVLKNGEQLHISNVYYPMVQKAFSGKESRIENQE